MRTLQNATPLVLITVTSTTVLKFVWDLFKASLSALFLVLAMFAAWGVWQKGALSFGAIGVIAFLLLLACAPWAIPRMSVRDKPAPRTMAVCGSVVALVCLDLARSALSYGWKVDECSAPGALFCHSMNMLYTLGGNALIAVTWLGAAALIIRATIRAVARAADDERAKLNGKGRNR
ncbi:MAG TPA: hypothetical protein VGO08_23925 [Burkholderiales bacterium]|jgi:hypothetical protein|nr:hypothetical protein [Burkholderiales bacterium]